MFNLTGILGTAIVLAAWFTSDSPPKQENVQMPPEEARFCSVLETADEVYEPVRKQWYAEKNGLVQDKIGVQLEEIVDRRNAEILKILGDSKPHISRWIVQITKIRTIDLDYNGVTKRYIDIAGRFPCKLPVTFTAVELPMTPPNTDFLGTKKIGDYIVVTASLIPHDAAMNSPQRAIEWSGFQGSSMATPGYRLSVEQMGNYTAE